MSWQPFDEFVRSRNVDEGLQTMVYSAHTKNEYAEIRQYLVNATATHSRPGRPKTPVTLMLGPCIALVNVFINSVEFDHANFRLTIKFVEAPRTPVRT